MSRLSSGVHGSKRGSRSGKNRLVVKGVGLERLKDVFKKLGKNPGVKVGVLGGSHGDLSLAELAAMLNFGSKHFPPRPFLSGAFDAKKSEWAAFARPLLVQVVLGQMSIAAALEQLGERAAADVKERLEAGTGLAPDAAATVAKKGGSQPLIETSKLAGAIKSKVVS